MSLSASDIQKLWESFKIQKSENEYVMDYEGLKRLFLSINKNVTDLDIRRIFSEVDTDKSGFIEYQEFEAALTSETGDHLSRLKIAFDVFDYDHTGKVGLENLEWVMSRFEMSTEEIKELLAEVDTSGDGHIDFEEFCKLAPEEVTKWYKDSPAPNTNLPDLETPPVPSTDTPVVISEPQKEEVIKPATIETTGTSRLQMQIGMFRLLQGAAYRSFRENYSANIETHLRVRNLPYTVSNFVKFIRTAIHFYKTLGIVDEACHPLLDAVVTSVEAEFERLLHRIKNWTNLEKTPEMIAAQKELENSRKKSYTLKEKFAAGIEYALTMRKNSLSLSDMVEGALAVQEINRLRHIDLNQNLSSKSKSGVSDPKLFLTTWNKVIVEKEEEIIDGAIIPVAYWYEDFMPKLLAAFRVGTEADIKSNTEPDVAALDQWYNTTNESGSFTNFGKDVLEEFPKCTPKQKLEIKQAWELTSCYLNGVQKRRERAEFGRDDGALSHYVTFIDVYLNRSSVQNAEMRLSFPYYIGCAVWHFFHTSAEIASSAPYKFQTSTIIPAFKAFFPYFATMYPCPYCRHHLNMYVVCNREVDMYPLEYVLLGRSPTKTSGDFEVNIDGKLQTITDGPSLRFFFWKLHNTVSSSISRTEEWYHKDNQAFYTTRFWPSLDSELTRAKIFGEINLSTDLVGKLYDLLKPMSQLAGLRRDFQRLLDEKKVDEVEEICKVANVQIVSLEDAVMRGNFLHDTYHFNPTLVDKPPSFSPEEEEFSRSGRFLAW